MDRKQKRYITVGGHLEEVSPELADQYDALMKARDKHADDAAKARSIARGLLLSLLVFVFAWSLHHGSFLVKHATLRFFLMDAPLVIFLPIVVFYRKKEWPLGFSAWWDSLGLPLLGLTALGYWLVAEASQRF